MKSIKTKSLEVFSIIAQNQLLALLSFLYATQTFFVSFLHFGLSSLALVEAFANIAAVIMFGSVLIIMTDYKQMIFSEIVTHKNNLSQLIKKALAWVFCLEFLVFLIIDVKLFSAIGFSVFTAVAILFVNYFIDGLKQGEEYNKQFEE